MKIIQDFIPKQHMNRPGYKLNPEYITIHETANTSAGANAAMHARYVKNPTTVVSWHFTVDDGDTIYQHLPLDEIGWHAGDGGSGPGNRSSIGIEICVNRDGDFEKAKLNAAALVRQLILDTKIPLERVVAHQHWSGKRCPANIINAGGIETFRALVPNKVTTAPTTPAEKPAKPAQKPKTNSIVDYLNAQGKDSSFAARKKLAEGYGIKNYSGTEEQNLQLLDFVRGNKAPAKPVPNKHVNVTPAKSGSVVDWLNKNKRPSDFNSRKKLADQYGIKNYKGTEAQNLQLLGFLQAGAKPASTPKKVAPAKSGSVVDWMNRNKLNSSFKNRESLAKKFGIKNYKGTESQNLQLLGYLQAGYR